MKLRVVLGLVMMAVLMLTGCGDEESESGGEAEAPPEAIAAAEEYLKSLQEQDAEAFLAIVNEPIYEYYFGGTVVGDAASVAQGVADGSMIVETGDDIAVELIHTSTDSALFAVVALRPNTEPTPVNGMIVLDLSQYPDRGWLITRDYRHGM